MSNDYGFKKGSTDARRGFILWYLTDNRADSLSTEILEKLFHPVKTKVPYVDDAEELRALGHPIRFRDDKFFIDNKFPAGRRPYKEVNQKKSIGQVVSSLVTGDDLHGIEQVVPLDIEAKSRIETFQKQSSRSIFMDSGSTASECGKKLARIKTPMDDGGHLLSLSIMTNGMSVLERLAGIDCTHDVICAGGFLRHDARSMGGDLMQRAVAAYQYVADIGFIGATGVHNGVVGCNHPWDAYAKRSIVSSCNLKCLIADASKFVSASEPTWRVMSLSQVDFVISDSAIKKNKAFVDEMKKRKVGILCESKKSTKSAKRTNS